MENNAIFTGAKCEHFGCCKSSNVSAKYAGSARNVDENLEDTYVGWKKNGRNLSRKLVQVQI